LQSAGPKIAKLAPRRSECEERHQVIEMRRHVSQARFGPIVRIARYPARTVGPNPGEPLAGSSLDAPHRQMRKLRQMSRLALMAAFVLPLLAQDTPWPVNGGPYNIRYTELSQITPANVSRLEVVWSWNAREEFKDSEMQSNPIVVDGVLYATTPRMHVVALDARTGRQLWLFDPSHGDSAQRRFRHRGLIVYKDRVFVTYRNLLYALDRKTGQPMQKFGEDGRIDLRKGLDRPFESQSVSASSPGVIFENLFIIGSTVPETLPGTPGDIRAYDTATGELLWTFHTIPHPGEFGYDTWPPDAWKINGGANAWAGLSVDPKLGMVFAATGSASFDFYGANRHGDNLFADCVIALDARTGKRIWHFQGVKHDLWDLDFPAPPQPGDGDAQWQARRSRGADRQDGLRVCPRSLHRRAAVSRGVSQGTGIDARW
jgi:quinoprotein glucose dehydrogenase